MNDNFTRNPFIYSQQEFKVVGYDVSLNKYEGNTLDFPNNGKNLTMYFLGYEDALYSANGE